MKFTKQQTVTTIICAVILAVVIVLNVAVAIFSPLLDKFVVGYKASEGSSATRAEGAALSEQISAEGTVLVKNAINETTSKPTLPLKQDDVPQVNVFGWASIDWVLSGSGSGQVKRAGSTDLLGALTEYGIGYNMGLTSMYRTFRSSREFSKGGSHAGGENEGNHGSSGSLHSFNYEFSRLYEPDIADESRYSQELLDQAKQFSDTAIVVIGRVSGESNDSPKVQYKNCSGKGMPADKYIDKTRTYLEISTEEEALLTYVGKNYENVIVIINSTNVMELGFLDTIPGIDACLIAATTGTAGAKALPKILYGDVTPSGKLVDTYAYDLSTSSTYANTGSGNDTTNFYTNGNGLYPTNTTHTNGSTTVPYTGVAYTDYCESVYVGYKWYETADEEGFWDSEYAKTQWGIQNGYADVVQYPFGFGLSYTTFSWNITYIEMTENTTIDLTRNNVIKVGVTVTNTGNYPGQDVVQLYYSATYGSIEKSSVSLGAFAKTQRVLQPGESEYVELTMNVEDMASYDYEGYKAPGGGYVLEKGNYVLTLRTDAHTIATDKIVTNDNSKHSTATIDYKVANDLFPKQDTVTNRFTGEEAVDGIAIDGNSDGTAEITYLTRSDFAGTFPAEMKPNRAMSAEVRKYNLYTEELANEWKEQNADAPEVLFGDETQGDLVYKDGKITEYGMQLGLDYDNAEWDGLLNRIKRTEMLKLVLNAYTETAAIASIGKPATTDYDGPNQVGSFSGGISDQKTGFSSITLAQSWNLQLAYSMGLAIGNESAGVAQGWYGPGLNVHRSPFGGRNYEYYSEDSLLSGKFAAQAISAAKNKGVFSYLKHICLYESESGRDGMYTWVTEQALREIYLKPFEIAVKEGGATGIMTSYGRIGGVWTGASQGLCQNVIADEWGFCGAIITDYSDHPEFMDADAMIRNNGDLFMRVGGGGFNYETSSNAFNNALRTATKDVVYMWLNALATNAQYNQKIESGEIQDTIVIPTQPELNFRWYVPVVIGVDVAAVAVCAVLALKTFKKKAVEVAETVTEEIAE